MFQFLKPAFNIFKKVLLVVIVYFAVISLFSHFISKDKTALISKTNPILENRIEIYKTINDKELNKTQQGKLTIFFYRGMMCSMMGEACTNNPADGDKNFNKSFLGFVNNLIILPFSNPPASGIAWTYSGLADAGFVKKSLAAEGIGMGSIQPFAKIWKVFRDVTYLLLVVILIAIGFMVMFRTKINPQTVISVENSLPKIIISLILITFSFAIAGFMIDLMYVLIVIVVSTLGPSSDYGYWGAINIPELQKKFINAGPGVIYGGLSGKWFDTMWTLPNAILNLIPLFGLIVKTIGGAIISFFSARIIAMIIAWLNGGVGFVDLIGSIIPTSGVGASVDLKRLLTGITTPLQVLEVIWIFHIISNLFVPLILGLIIWFSLVFVFFRIIFMLFNSYIKILLSIILSPIYLLFEAIPGQSAFANWIKNLAGEMITFPLIVGIFLLGNIIVKASSEGELIKFPFLVGIDSQSFGFIIGMALLFMTPDLVKAVRAIFIPKPGLLDQAGPGIFFGGATTGISGGLGELSKVAGIGFYIKPVSDFLRGLPGGKAIFGEPHSQPAPHNP